MYFDMPLTCDFVPVKSVYTKINGLLFGFKPSCTGR
jgi:hypothetical protein